MNYMEAKAKRDMLESSVKAFSARLSEFPKGTMGLTLDSAKASPEWKETKLAYDMAFTDLQRFNRYFVKAFAAEIKTERNAKFKG
jgi:hypothetical protein